MSVKRLESMLKRLEKTESEAKRRLGGFEGIGHSARSFKKGGILSGGILSGGILSGGKVENFAGVQGGAKNCTCCPACGGRLTGGRYSGGRVENFAGVAGGVLMPNNTGGILLPNNTTGGRYKKGGSAVNFAGVQGGAVENFAGVQGGRYKKGVRANPPQLNAWRSHLNAYRQAHPDMSLKDQMREASKSYKK